MPSVAFADAAAANCLSRSSVVTRARYASTTSDSGGTSLHDEGRDETGVTSGPSLFGPCSSSLSVGGLMRLKTVVVLAGTYRTRFDPSPTRSSPVSSEMDIRDPMPTAPGASDADSEDCDAMDTVSAYVGTALVAGGRPTCDPPLTTVPGAWSQAANPTYIITRKIRTKEEILMLELPLCSGVSPRAECTSTNAATTHASKAKSSTVQHR